MYEGPYAPKLTQLERLMGPFRRKRILDVGCGRVPVANSVDEKLAAVGANVTAVDIDYDGPATKAGVAYAKTNILELGTLPERDFDVILALALFGSPFSKWCDAAGRDLREAELEALQQIRSSMKKGGFALLYNADAWQKHSSTLSEADFVRAGFLLAGQVGNDTFILRKRE